MQNSTIVALATAPGVGGIAVVRLSGSESLAIAAQVFVPRNAKRSVQNAKGYTCMYGTFWHGTRRIDDGIATFFRAPQSYTGEDVVELCCHGGSVLAEQLIQSCIRAGAQPAAAGEYTKRAFLNGKLQLTQAEAVMELIHAEGQQGAQLAQTALRGALAAEIQGYKQQLVALAGHCAAWVDFPEEDVPALQEQQLLSTLHKQQQGLRQLVEQFHSGEVVRHGIEAAIVGRPNVGKSTLLNLLAGFERAIVTAVPGTTRDVVQQAVQIGDVRLNLADTAGIRTTQDEVEAEGIRRSQTALQSSVLVFAVFDASQAATAQDVALAQQCAAKTAIAVLNKTDLPVRFDPAQIAPFFGQIVEISAQNGQGMQQLAQAVQTVLGTKNLNPDAPCLVNRRQFAQASDALCAVQDAIAAVQGGFGLDAVSVCLDDAIAALCRLSGEQASEAVIEEVFSTFCVGK